MVKIYQKEINDGIADAVSNDTLTVASHIRSTDMNRLMQSIASANKGQRDLYYKHSIIASTGINSNDDVFIKSEAWKARNTIADKQLNLEHNDLVIIGHMTDSSVYGLDGQLIADNTPIEDVPDDFDLVSEFVIYREWQNEERESLVASIIDEIEQGKWFVSMECLFPHFDYALISPDGVQQVIARNEQTSFLTKYLRRYGGPGVYKGQRLGRVLRDLFFSGQGIVSNPANDRSIILDISSIEKFSSQGSLEEIKDDEMELEKQLSEALAQIESLNAEIAEQKNSAEAIKVEYETKLATASEQIQGLQGEIEIHKHSEDVLSSELKSTKASAEQLQSELNEIKRKRVFELRKERLVACKLDSVKIDESLAKFENLSDEVFDSFASLLESVPVSESAATEQVADQTPTEDTKASEPTVTEVAKIEDVEPEDSVELNTQATNDTNEKVIASVQAFLSSHLKYSSKANKN